MLSFFAWLAAIVVLLWAIFIAGMVYSEKLVSPQERTGVFLAIVGAVLMLPFTILCALNVLWFKLFPRRNPERGA